MIKRYPLATFLFLVILTSWGCGAKKQPVHKPTTAPPPSLSQPNGQVMVVTAGPLNLRACPGMECRVIAVLPRGQRVIKLGAKAGWLRVRVPSIQKEGWVGARYVGIGKHKSLELPPPPPSASPKVKEEWVVPAKQEAQKMEKEEKTPKRRPAPEVQEEWATPEKQEAPEVKEEFAK
jgi:hypothetical protein